MKYQVALISYSCQKYDEIKQNTPSSSSLRLGGGMHSDARFLATRVLINTGFTKSNSCSPISFKENESNINKTNPRGEKT